MKTSYTLGFCGSALGVFCGMAPFVAVAASATSWTCRNADLEVSCTSEACVAAQEHTPMDIRVSPQDISICAYTTCWSGAPSAVQLAAGFTSFTGAQLAGSSDQQDTVDAVITLETATGVASVFVAGVFVTPAICVAD